MRRLQEGASLTHRAPARDRRRVHRRPSRHLQGRPGPGGPGHCGPRRPTMPATYADRRLRAMPRSVASALSRPRPEHVPYRRFRALQTWPLRMGRRAQTGHSVRSRRTVLLLRVRECGGSRDSGLVVPPEDIGFPGGGDACAPGGCLVGSHDVVEGNGRDHVLVSAAAGPAVVAAGRVEHDHAGAFDEQDVGWPALRVDVGTCRVEQPEPAPDDVPVGEPGWCRCRRRYPGRCRSFASQQPARWIAE